MTINTKCAKIPWKQHTNEMEKIKYQPPWKEKNIHT